MVSSKPGYKLLIKFTKFFNNKEKNKLKFLLNKVKYKIEKKYPQRISNILNSF